MKFLNKLDSSVGSFVDKHLTKLAMLFIIILFVLLGAIQYKDYIESHKPNSNPWIKIHEGILNDVVVSSGDRFIVGTIIIKFKDGMCFSVHPFLMINKSWIIGKKYSLYTRETVRSEVLAIYPYGKDNPKYYLVEQ